MEIRVLRYFLTVVREEGVTRAAEVLHITQPTLSRQLSQLEEEVGVKLFHRGAKKITLTNEGLLLKRRAEEILSLVDRTERELAEQDELVEGRIVIAAGKWRLSRSFRGSFSPSGANTRGLLTIFLRPTPIS